MIRPCLVALKSAAALLALSSLAFAELSGYDLSSVYDGTGGAARGFLEGESPIRVDGRMCGWSYEFSPTKVFEGKLADLTFHSTSRIPRYDREEHLVFLGAFLEPPDDEGAPASCYDGFRYFVFREHESIFPIRRRFLGVVGREMVFSGESGFLTILDFPPSERVPLDVVVARFRRLVLWLQDPEATGSITFH